MSDSSKSTTMRSVVWEGKPFHMAVHDLPKPKIEAPTDAVIRVTTAAICGSDLHTYHGILGSANVPYGMGHEAVGVVIEVGDAVSTIKVGDRVVIADIEREFPTFEVFGEGSFGGNLGGCQAEYVRVPLADESNLLKIPDNALNDADYVLMSDIWPTAWGGLDFAGFEPGDSVAVFGAGPVGLLCAYSALLRGASTVFSVDYVPARLEKAASIGTIPINFTKGSPSDQILAKLPAGVQRVVDCYGYECVNEQLKPQENYIITQAVDVVADAGGIGLIGVYETVDVSKGAPLANTVSPNISFPVSTFWAKSLKMAGGGVIAKDLWPQLQPLIESGRARPSFVVSVEIGIEKAPHYYARFSERLETKVLIKFPWEWGKDDDEHVAVTEDATNGANGAVTKHQGDFALQNGQATQAVARRTVSRLPRR